MLWDKVKLFQKFLIFLSAMIRTKLWSSKYLNCYRNSLEKNQYLLVGGFQHCLVTDSCRDGWNVRNCSASQVQNFWDRWNVQNSWWIKCTKLADLSRTLNINTPVFVLFQLQQHRVFVSSETHVDVVVLGVRVVFTTETTQILEYSYSNFR